MEPIIKFHCPISVESGSERRGVQPIMFRGAGISAKHVLSISPCHPIRFFGTEILTGHMKSRQYITVDKLLFSFLLVARWAPPSPY